MKRISTDKDESESAYDGMAVQKVRKQSREVFEIDEKEEHVDLYSDDENEVGINKEPRMSDI